MPAPKDGGPAFPSPLQERDHGKPIEIHPELGMSLRDWFAGQALAGMLANGPGMVAISEATAHVSVEESQIATVRVAYDMADAMLFVRTKA